MEKVKMINMPIYNINIINTKRFNNIIIKIIFTREYEESEIALLELLSHYLEMTTKNYPEEDLLNRRKLELYGLAITVTSRRYGKKTVLEFALELTDPKKLKDNYLEDALLLFFEVILNPNVNDNSFNIELLEKIKAKVKLDVSNRLSKVYPFSQQRLYELVDDEGLLKNSIYNHVDDIDKISGKKLYNFYKKAIEGSHKEVFVLGPCNNNEIASIFREHFIVNNSDLLDTKYNKYLLPFRNKPQYIKERKLEYNQSCLMVCYKVKDIIEEDIIKLNIIAGFLSDSSVGLLRKKLREEVKLVYSCGTVYQKRYGLITIYARIKSSNYDKALSAIEDVINGLKEGKDIDAYLNKIKRAWELDLLRFEDNKYRIINNLEATSLGRSENIYDQYSRVVKLTNNQLISTINKLTLDTVYFLEGGKDNG